MLIARESEPGTCRHRQLNGQRSYVASYLAMAVSSDVYIVRVDSDDDCICIGAEGGGRKGKTPAKGNRRQKRSLRSAAIVVEDSPPAATVAMKIKPPSLANKRKANLESLPARTESGNDSMPPFSIKGLLTPTSATTIEVDGPPRKRQSLSIEVDGNDGPRQTLSTTVHSDAEAHSSLHHGNEDEVEPMETSPSAVTDNTANQSDRDFQLALQLYEQLNRERSPYSAADEELARKLQSEEYASDIKTKSLLTADEKLAKRLQKVEDDAAVKVIKATKIVVNPSTSPQPKAAARTSTSVETAAVINSPQPFDTSVTGSNIAAQLHSQGTHSQPSNWTVCPKCPPDAVRTYHLIKLPASSEEWIQISAPLTSVGFQVTAVQRIQNNTLWQRFQSERQLMVQGRPEGFDVNEKILYHTSRAAKRVICEEGLDQRLSRCGSFGCGIYFRFGIGVG